MADKITPTIVTDKVLTLTNRVGVLTASFPPLRARIVEDVDTLRSSSSADHRTFAADRLKNETLPQFDHLLELLTDEVASAEGFLQHIPNGPGTRDRLEEVSTIKEPIEKYEEHLDALDQLGEDQKDENGKPKNPQQ